MGESLSGWIRARRIRVVCAALGGAAVALAPLIYEGAQVPWREGNDIPIGYAVLTLFVYALIGAVGGWAIGAVIASLTRPPR